MYKETLIHLASLHDPCKIPPAWIIFVHFSHLPFLGKVIEKMVVWQRQRILDETDYLNPFQSGFRLSMGQKQPWLHLWMISGKSGMGVI